MMGHRNPPGWGAFPSDDDIAFYRAHGYVVSPPLLPPELLESARYGVMRYYEGERDWQLPISGGFLDWHTEHGDGLRINDYVSLQNRELRNLVLFPALGWALARLMGVRTVRLFHDQLISKSPGYEGRTAVGWHVDQAYWDTCTSDRMLTAWIPLERYSADMGPVMVIPGSHRWQDTGWMRTFSETDLPGLERRVAQSSGIIEKVRILIEPGCVSFHHSKTIHGSEPNRGDRPRLALTVHAQDGDNRYRPGSRAYHMNELLCRRDEDYQPDYTDPDICPVLYSED